MGGVETLVTLIPNNTMKVGKSIPLICLDEDGKERWRFTPGHELRSGRDPFNNLFQVANFDVLRMSQNRPNVVLVSAIHMPDYPCQIALLDIRTGKAMRQYWHSGYIGNYVNSMLVNDLNRDGISEIYLGGVNNAAGKATLVVLDPDDFDGISHEAQRDYQLLGSPAGREIRRILFPHTCLDSFVTGFGSVEDLAAVPGGLCVRVTQYQNSNRNIVNFYYFATDGHLVKMSPTDEFRNLHNEMSHNGYLDYSFSSEEIRSIEKAVLVLPSSHLLLPPTPSLDSHSAKIK